MDAARFDHLAKIVSRRTSRRAALRTMGVGIAAGLTARAGLVEAQEATPAPNDAGEPRATMFVQTAHGGHFIPKPDEDGVYQVVLRGVSAQTAYFTDRPERLVGSVSTAHVLAELGFTSENPPNAAIVVQTEEGGEDILVVELLNPDYHSGNQSLTYDVVVLDEYAGDGLGELAQRQDDGELPISFGQTSLFIDDCPDLTVCVNDVDRENGYQPWSMPIPGGPYTQAWTNLGCQPVDNDGQQLLKGQLAYRCSQANPKHCPDFGYWYACDPR
jgi:hypothetical protein